MSRVVAHIVEEITEDEQGISSKAIGIQIETEYQDDYDALLTTDEFSTAVMIVEQSVLSISDIEANVHGSPGALFEFLFTNWQKIEIKHTIIKQNEEHNYEVQLQRNEATKESLYTALSCIQDIMSAEISALQRRIVERLRNERVKQEQEKKKLELLYETMQDIEKETKLVIQKVEQINSELKALRLKLEHINRKQEQAKSIFSRIYGKVKNFFKNVFQVFKKHVQRYSDEVKSELDEKERLKQEIEQKLNELAESQQRLNELADEFNRIVEQYRDLQRHRERDDWGRGRGGPRR